MGSKQVIVMRKFQSLRVGKYCAQASHASLGAVFDLAQSKDPSRDFLVIPLDNPAVKDWINGRFTKITVYVKEEQELIDLYQKAKEAGLPASLIRDAGLTEFSEPTLTAVGIGPGDAALIDTITGHLPLF